MDNMRMVASHPVKHTPPCSRCGRDDHPWDRIADRAYCPDCQEEIILGLSRPFKARTEKRACAACGRTGTVRYVTQPRQTATALEIDLCAAHLRGLLGRRLDAQDYHQLRRRLRSMGVSVERVFLLHDVFYDIEGNALCPAADPE